MIGAAVEDRFSATIRQKIQNLIGSKSEWFSVRKAHYISVKSNWLSMLENEDYLLSKKGKGLRTLLYLFTTPEGPAAFLFTSQNSMWYNPMVFPLPNNPSLYHTDCLIDGELNFSQNSDRPASVVFTAFDLIAIGGVSVTRRSLSTRLGSDIITPRLTAIKNNPSIPQPFQYLFAENRIEMCHYERSYGLKASIAHARTSKATGLIFTPVKMPYTPYRVQSLSYMYSQVEFRFQWILPEENSFPFKIQIIWDKERKAHYQIFIAERQTHKYFDDFTPDPELLMAWRQAPPDGKIIDCIYDPEWVTHIWENGYAVTSRKGGWKFVRPDRTFADEERSLNERFESLINPLPEKHIEDAADSIRSKWKEREALPANKVDKRIEGSPQQSLSEFKRKSIPISESSSPSTKRPKTDNLSTTLEKGELEEGQMPEEEEVELLSGYVPCVEIIVRPAPEPDLGTSPQTVHTMSQKPVHVVLQNHIPSPAVQKPIPSPIRNNISSPSKLMDLAQKTNLQKSTTLFIPVPPPPATILTKAESDDEESPLEDLTTKRYATALDTPMEYKVSDGKKAASKNKFWDVI